MPKAEKLVIYTDGGARGNPGPAGIGVVIYNSQKKVIKKYKGFLGTKTNNEAEYMAVLQALKKAEGIKADEIQIFMDSELVARQLNSIYKVKQPHLQELLLQVRNLEQNFHKVSYQHVPREKNKSADRLVNEAIDQARGKN